MPSQVKAQVMHSRLHEIVRLYYFHPASVKAMVASNGFMVYGSFLKF